MKSKPGGRALYQLSETGGSEHTPSLSGDASARPKWAVFFESGHLNDEPRWRYAAENEHNSSGNNIIGKHWLAVASSKDVNAMRGEPVADRDEKASCEKNLQPDSPVGRRQV